MVWGKKFIKPIKYLIVIILLILCTLDLIKKPENQFLNNIAISGIDYYQTNFSEKLTFIKCSHHETCSHFTKRVLKEKGLVKGSIESLKRIITCF